MPSLETNNFRWRLLVAGALIMLVAWYGFFQARHLIFGPVVEIETPTEGLVTRHPTIDLKGQVKNVQEIKVNGRAITITPSGDFDEKLSLSSRYNLITIEARDRFGSQKKIERVVILTQDIPHPLERIEELETDKAVEEGQLQARLGQRENN